MPKELTHWHIAERTASIFREGDSRDPARASIESYPEAFLLGAVAYDTPFYAIASKHKSVFAAVGNDLHGVSGEDTLERFRRIAPSVDSSAPAAPTAFFAGALTHYTADTTIHPLVNYFCDGTPFPQRNHRAFETCMDLFVIDTWGRPGGTGNGMGGLLSSVDTGVITEATSRLFWPTPRLPKEIIANMLKRHAFIRDRFERRAWQTLLRWFASFGDESAKTIAATFYPSKRRAQAAAGELAGFFSSAVEFTHPHTGERRNLPLETLIEEAAEKAADLIRIFVADDMPGTPGLSLDSGCDLSTYPVERHSGSSDLLASICRWYSIGREHRKTT